VRDPLLGGTDGLFGGTGGGVPRPKLNFLEDSSDPPVFSLTLIGLF